MPKSSDKKGRSALVFQKQNYQLLLGGLALIIGGFVAMYLDGQFEGFISLTVSPLLILTGYVVVGGAILWWPDGRDEEGSS